MKMGKLSVSVTFKSIVKDFTTHASVQLILTQKQYRYIKFKVSALHSKLYSSKNT